jgi:hypothetical protein
MGWLPYAIGLLLLLLVAVAGYRWWAYESWDPAFGRFEGDIITKWITPDREMELMQDFHYIDPRGKQWTAATGTVINGASIPRAFWSLIGGPFEGRFRNASVVHDAACGAQTESWQDVHRMFYDACRCARVGEGKAQTMYWAVYHFGPRWQSVMESRIENGQPVTTMRMMTVAPTQPDEDVVKKAAAYFEKRSLSPEAIEACTVEKLEEEVARWEAERRAAGGGN